MDEPWHQAFVEVSDRDRAVEIKADEALHCRCVQSLQTSSSCSLGLSSEHISVRPASMLVWRQAAHPSLEYGLLCWQALDWIRKVISSQLLGRGAVLYEPCDSQATVKA